MSEPERIKDTPKPSPSQDQAKEPVSPKTSQSAFDKALEQARVVQQNPLSQSKFTDQGASEQRVKETTKRQDDSDDKKKDEDRSASRGPDKSRQKEKGSETITREAVGKVADKKGSRGDTGSGGRDKGGFGGDLSKKQAATISKKMADARAMISSLNQSTFAGKLLQAKQAALKLSPQQMQAMVNQIVQSIQIGKNQLGWQELRLVLRENVFSGLRLRFTSKHGKVSVQFETADRRVKDLFNAESKNIQAALEERGVAVSEIKVS